KKRARRQISFRSRQRKLLSLCDTGRRRFQSRDKELNETPCTRLNQGTKLARVRLSDTCV
ncbi:MAG: hypothetical protein MHM6MM_009507, partial [Cercozoa sp. M6MM]